MNIFAKMSERISFQRALVDSNRDTLPAEDRAPQRFSISLIKMNTTLKLRLQRDKGEKVLITKTSSIKDRITIKKDRSINERRETAKPKSLIMSPHLTLQLI